MGGGRGPEAATGGHVGGPRRCRQPPLACDLGAGGSPWRGVGLWGVRPGVSRHSEPGRAGPGVAGSGPRSAGAYATLARPHRPGCLVSWSLRRSPRTQAGFLRLGPRAGSRRARASLPLWSAPRSIHSGLIPAGQGLCGPGVGGDGGSWPGGPGVGAALSAAAVSLRSWPRAEPQCLPSDPGKRRKAYLFFLGFNLVMK